jgi:hypothetical protein
LLLRIAKSCTTSARVAMLSSFYTKELWWECCIPVLLCNRINFLEEQRIVRRTSQLSSTSQGSQPVHWNRHRREKISRRPQSLSVARPIFNPTNIASPICRMFTLSLNGNVVDKMTWRTPSQLASASCKIVSTALTGIAAYGDHIHAYQFGRSEVSATSEEEFRM